MTSLDVHSYDGKLGNSLSGIDSHLSFVRTLPITKKMEMIKKLEGELLKTTCYVLESRKNFSLVVNSPSGHNYDPSNKVDALDLLCVCSIIVENKKDDDVLAIICTQLQEISLGACAQGRTHRLLQAIVSLEEFLHKE